MTDADLDVSHPTPADVESARALSHAYDQAARGVGGIAERFARDAGAVVEGSRDEFTSVRATFDQAAMDLAVIASVLADLRQAGDRWLRDAPKSADFAAAQAAIDAARAALRAAANADQPTAAAQERVVAAERALRDLRARRKAADEAYGRACERAAAKLPRGRGKCKPSKSGERDYTGEGKGGTPAPSPSAPAPTSRPPSTRTATAPPAAPAPPPLTAPAPAVPTVPANLTPPAPVAPAPLHVPMPPMPQVAPSGPASAPRRDNRDRTSPAFETPDLAGLLATGSAPAAAAPRPAASVAAPVAAPAPAPVATNPGYSANNLSTASEVLGRTPGGGAYAAPTGLSAGHAVQQMHGAAGGTTAGTGTGAAPMSTPMLPGTGGGMPAGGGGSARDREQIRSYSPLGIESVAEAIPGGTLCQKRGEKLS